jgi:NAD(P)-dependent dehydrogenase (short-subunit alcohol dehydrogenase family)
MTGATIRNQASNVVIVGVGNVGFALAELLGGTHKVHLVDRRRTDDVAKLVAKGATFSEVDATDAAAMTRELASIKELWNDSIHALVVTVGGYSTATPLTEFSTFKAYFDLNVFGVLMPIKACLAVNEGSPCRIVVLSSTSGHHAPATLDAYAPSKWALENICGAIGAELHGTGSTIDVLCPTNLSNVRSKDFLSDRGLAPEYMDRNPSTNDV